MYHQTGQFKMVDLFLIPNSVNVYDPVNERRYATFSLQSNSKGNWWITLEVHHTEYRNGYLDIILKSAYSDVRSPLNRCINMS
jgi:hypothetical protein